MVTRRVGAFFAWPLVCALAACSQDSALLEPPAACGDLPLRHEALAAAESDLFTSIADHGATELVPEVIWQTRTLALVYNFDEWMNQEEQAIVLRSDQELRDFLDGSGLDTEVDALGMDWTREVVIASLEYPAQRIYKYATIGDTFRVYAGRVDACPEYGRLADQLLSYADTVRFYRLPSVDSADVESVVAHYRFNPVPESVAQCERVGKVMPSGASAQVIREGDDYRLFYSGFSAATGVMFDAMSSDGVDWNPSGWDPAHQLRFEDHGEYTDHYSASMIRVGDEYWMYYTHVEFVPPRNEREGTLRRAVSEDGINWRDETVALERGQPGTWDSDSVSNPTVVHTGDRYLMWYDGSDGGGTFSIGVAESVDGISWQRLGTAPVITPGDAGSFDDLATYAGAVLRTDSGYVMWYSTATGGGDARFAVLEQIAVATSPDGLTWEKSERPLLQPRSSWESEHIGQPEVLIEGDQAWIWYTAINERAEPAIALAQCPL